MGILLENENEGGALPGRTQGKQFVEIVVLLLKCAESRVGCLLLER